MFPLLPLEVFLPVFLTCNPATFVVTLVVASSRMWRMRIQKSWRRPSPTVEPFGPCPKNVSYDTNSYRALFFSFDDCLSQKLVG